MCDIFRVLSIVLLFGGSNPAGHYPNLFSNPAWGSYPSPLPNLSKKGVGGIFDTREK